MSNETVPVHPVQVRPANHYDREDGPAVPQVVSLRAYEVYRKLYGSQEAMITGTCRGGFGTGELMAFLYAHSFPESEWRVRFDEALTGMRL